jgi:hypothetical protein
MIVVWRECGLRASVYGNTGGQKFNWGCSGLSLMCSGCASERTPRWARLRSWCWGQWCFWDGGPVGGGLQIQVFWLPIGTRVFGWMPSGADTEVRPPATLVLGPCGGCSRWRAHWGCRLRSLGCPSDEFSSDPSPAERTQRSAPPRPWCCALAEGVLGCGHMGVTDPCSLAARWDSGFRMFVQRSGHRGPPPRHPVPGPWERVFVGGGPAGIGHNP